MPNKYWLGTTSDVYSLAANWAATSGGASGDGKPGIGDDVIFDNRTGAGSNPCTLDEATAAINSLSVHDAGEPGGVYSAKLDFAGFVVNITGGGNAIFEGSGEVDCDLASGSLITCSGNWKNDTQGTWTPGTSLVVMDTDGKTMSVHQNRDFYDLQISGNVTANGSFCDTVHTLTVDATKTFTAGSASIRMVSDSFDNLIELNGTIDVTGSEVLFLTASTANDRTITIGASGRLTGDGGVQMRDVVVDNTAGGTWDIATTLCRANCQLSEGTYDGTWLCESQHGTRTLTLGTAGAQTLTFLGDMTFDQDVSSGDYLVDMTTWNPNVEFRGNLLTISESGGGTGTLTWDEGSGITTFGGATTFDDSTGLGANLGNVIVSSDNSLILADDMECDTFIGQQRSIIDDDGLGDYTLTVNSSFLLDGASGNRVTWSNVKLDVNLAGTAVATFTDVTDSDASAGKEVTATDNCTDTGANPNWDFGAAAFGGSNIILGGGILA